MGASLKDIACKLNLSKTTVSWVLSGQGDKKGISAETQSRVLACARSLAYEPNLLARSLNTGVSKTIGLILPSISDTFFAHIADRIESEAEREGYSLMIAGSNSETERENALIRLFRSKKVDGIIIAPADASGCEVGRLAESGCPVVLFDRGLAKTDAGCVVIDNEAGSHALVRHLAARGFRKIAIITTFPHLPTMELRHRGYLRALAEAGRTPIPASTERSPMPATGSTSAIRSTAFSPRFPTPTAFSSPRISSPPRPCAISTTGASTSATAVGGLPACTKTRFSAWPPPG